MEGLNTENTKPQTPLPESFDDKLSTEETSEEIIMREIEDLALPLIQKMKEKIDEGAYDLIISDEGSGRIPTLLFRKIYQAINPDKDFDTLFVNGARGVNDPGEWSNVKLFAQCAENGRHKALVVTDYVSSGTSLEHFLENLKYATITDVSVAALRTSYDEHDPDSKSGGTIAGKFTDFFEGDINRGKVLKVADLRDDARQMVGVEKIWERSQMGYNHPAIVKDFDGEKVKKTRNDIDAIAKRIIEKVWQNTETSST